jgi:basic amino acid/polyamine antiporter, APA family
METVSAAQLRPAIRRSQYLALGFGTILGSGWVVLLGAWLRHGGPGGAVLGFVLGGIAMSLVAAVYAELAARMPTAGGDFIYAYEIFGPRFGFFVGWFMTLFLIGVCAFEGIALPWMIQSLFPAFAPGRLYSFLDAEVTVGALVCGLIGLLVITFLNYREIKAAMRVHVAITSLLVAVVLAVVVASVSEGNSANAQPLFASLNGQRWWIGAGWVFATTAFTLNGFQAIQQTIEERGKGVGIRAIAFTMIASVAAAALFYCVVILASALASPWEASSRQPLATGAAVEPLIRGGVLKTVVLLTAAISLFKTWNAVALMAARILLAQARVRLLPVTLARIHPRYGTPSNAVVFVAACTLAGILLGRGAIVPIVDMASICLAFSYVVACIEVLRLRRTSTNRGAAFTVPGGRWTIYTALAASCIMAGVAFLQPLADGYSGIPVEWAMMLAWAIVGEAFYRWYRARVAVEVAR